MDKVNTSQTIGNRLLRTHVSKLDVFLIEHSQNEVLIAIFINYCTFHKNIEGIDQYVDSKSNYVTLANDMIIFSFSP